MGIYFRDILLIRISRGANNCGQHSLEKNSYFTMRFSPHFQLFYFNDRLEFCEFFEWKIKRINNADLFSQLPLLIFIKGANISGGHCICLSAFIVPSKSCKLPIPYALMHPHTIRDAGFWTERWWHTGRSTSSYAGGHGVRDFQLECQIWTRLTIEHFSTLKKSI